MAKVTFHFEAHCATGFCDSSATFCISLFREAKPGVAAKSFYECYSGNVGLSGEQLALMVLADVKAKTGIKGKLTSTPTEEHSSREGDIQFDGIDEWDAMSTAEYLEVGSAGGTPHPGKPGRPPERWRKKDDRQKTLGAVPGESLLDLLGDAPWGTSVHDLLQQETGDLATDHQDSASGFHWLRFEGDSRLWGPGVLLLTLKHDTRGEFIPVTVLTVVSGETSAVLIARDLSIKLVQIGHVAMAAHGELRILSDGGGASSLLIQFFGLELRAQSPHFIGGFSALDAPGLGTASRQHSVRSVEGDWRSLTAAPDIEAASPLTTMSTFEGEGFRGPGRAEERSPLSQSNASHSACTCGPLCVGACHG